MCFLSMANVETLAFAAPSFNKEKFHTIQQHISPSKYARTRTGNYAHFNFPLHRGKESSNPGSAMQMSLSLRGGSAALIPAANNPTTLFNTNLMVLAAATALIRVGDKFLGSKDSSSTEETPKPAAVKSLQIRFLAVFWLLRCADWLQG